MCDFISPIIGAVAAVGSSLFASKKQKAPAAPVVQSYNPDSANNGVEVTAPAAPVASPTFGQKSAEDMQKDDINGSVKKKKKGRASLIIQRDVGIGSSGGSGGSTGSGTVVPKG